jgi:hypothetical protein
MAFYIFIFLFLVLCKLFYNEKSGNSEMCRAAGGTPKRKFAVVTRRPISHLRPDTSESALPLLVTGMRRAAGHALMTPHFYW